MKKYPLKKIFREITVIIVISITCGFVFNLFSPHGINIFDNPWSGYNNDTSNYQLDNDNDLLQEPIVFVTLDRACRFVEGKEGMILDVRTPEEYAEGHIAGAHLLFFYNMNEYYPKLEAQLKESPAILTYCGNIECEDSGFLANELFNLGHVPVLVYKGGFEEWKSSGLPVERGGEETRG